MALHTKYAELMAHHPFGHALYHPKTLEELRPGLCGYFDRYGQWQPLVDLTKPEDLKKRGFTQIELPEMAPKRGMDMQWGPKTSTNVKSQQVGGGAGVSGNAAAIPADLGVEFEFSSAHEYGAVLLTGDSVERDSFYHEHRFKPWCKANQPELIRHAREVASQSLWIVTGVHSTPKCSLTVNVSRSKAVKVGFNAKAMVAGELNLCKGWQIKTTDSGWIHAGHAAKSVSVAGDDSSKPRIVVFITGLQLQFRPKTLLRQDHFHDLQEKRGFIDSTLDLPKPSRTLALVGLTAVTAGLFWMSMYLRYSNRPADSDQPLAIPMAAKTAPIDETEDTWGEWGVPAKDKRGKSASRGKKIERVPPEASPELKASPGLQPPPACTAVTVAYYLEADRVQQTDDVPSATPKTRRHKGKKNKSSIVHEAVEDDGNQPASDSDSELYGFSRIDSGYRKLHIPYSARDSGRSIALESKPIKRRAAIDAQPSIGDHALVVEKESHSSSQDRLGIPRPRKLSGGPVAGFSGLPDASSRSQAPSKVETRLEKPTIYKVDSPSTGAIRGGSGLHGFSQEDNAVERVTEPRARRTLTDLDEAWPIERVIEFLQCHGFSPTWHTVFKELTISGSTFLEIGVGSGGRRNPYILHNIILPCLQKIQAEKFDRDHAREEAQRLRLLIRHAVTHSVAEVSSQAQSPRSEAFAADSLLSDHPASLPTQTLPQYSEGDPPVPPPLPRYKASTMQAFRLPPSPPRRIAEPSNPHFGSTVSASYTPDPDAWSLGCGVPSSSASFATSRPSSDDLPSLNMGTHSPAPDDTLRSVSGQFASVSGAIQEYAREAGPQDPFRPYRRSPQRQNFDIMVERRASDIITRIENDPSNSGTSSEDDDCFVVKRSAKKLGEASRSEGDGHQGKLTSVSSEADIDDNDFDMSVEFVGCDDEGEDVYDRTDAGEHKMNHKNVQNRMRHAVRQHALYELGLEIADVD